ncbi:MAG: 16S rRNA (adenine(1518)-N(6)/adenine(1519)-N(6))-dimethyltransferase RsmA [Gammaproteobacteria bacterium]
MSGGRHIPRRRFGQHFLHDPRVIERIVSAIAPAATDRLVEIGPGEGVLTARLAEQAGTLDVIEIDRDLAAHLRERFCSVTGLTVHCADALRFDLRTLAGADAPLRVVGNLPYNISTPLLFHLFDASDRIAEMVFMLQHEVAQRLAAAPDSRAYGRLSVMAQYRCAIEFLFPVSPGAFRPPPKVQSAVVRLKPRPWVPPARSAAQLARLVSAAFGKRRKTLRNALAGLAGPAAFEAAGIDPSRRAETLSVAEFVRLSDCAAEMVPGASAEAQ